MDSEISLIRSLAKTLLSEIDSINGSDHFQGQNTSVKFEQNTPIVLSDVVRKFEVKLIKTALVQTGGNQRQAAFLLGVKVTTLHNKIKTYGINFIGIPA